MTARTRTLAGALVAVLAVLGAVLATIRTVTRAARGIAAALDEEDDA